MPSTIDLSPERTRRIEQEEAYARKVALAMEAKSAAARFLEFSRVIRR
jgi:hypothetical protein